jgi:hypothetical protein
MDNAADRKSIRRREKAARLADVQRREVIVQLMSSAAGRQYVWDKLSECHIYVTTFNGDALQSAYMEGQRAIGLAMLSDLMIACPDQYILAMREANVRSTTDERRSSPVDDGGDTGSGPDAAGDDLDFDYLRAHYDVDESGGLVPKH